MYRLRSGKTSSRSSKTGGGECVQTTIEFRKRKRGANLKSTRPAAESKEDQFEVNALSPPKRGRNSQELGKSI